MKIQSLYLYPIKGMRGVSVSHVIPELQALKYDRKYAFVFLDTLKEKISDYYNAQWLDKGKLLVQNDWPCLAEIEIQTDDEYHCFEFKVSNHSLGRFDFRIDQDRQSAEEAVLKYISSHSASKVARHPQATKLKLVGSSSGTHFPDRGKFALSILNLASLRALSESVGKKIEIDRFRGNVIVDTNEPWSELNWTGKALQFKQCKVVIQKPIGRCHNINVHAETGDDSIRVLETLKASTGKTFFGVMANFEVQESLTVGESFSVID